MEIEKRDEENERNRALEDMQGDDGSKMIILPQYEMDKRLKVDREKVPSPPDSVFIGLGWDEDSTT